MNAWHKKCGRRLKAKDGELRYLCKHCNEYVENDSEEITHDEGLVATKRMIHDNEKVRKAIDRVLEEE